MGEENAAGLSKLCPNNFPLLLSSVLTTGVGLKVAKLAWAMAPCRSCPGVRGPCLTCGHTGHCGVVLTLLCPSVVLFGSSEVVCVVCFFWVFFFFVCQMRTCKSSQVTKLFCKNPSIKGRYSPQSAFSNAWGASFSLL